MIVSIDRDGRAGLDDADNFRAFKVTAACAPEVLGKAITPIGALDRDGRAWISRKWLLANGREDDAEWRGGFDKMIAYAKEKGWLDEQRDLVRAHVEQV